MAALYTGQWINFFLQAGIPQKAAATYALTFAENRIQMNMLLDLNKEYLRDMGITVMGDVIAILRHARTTHEEMAREKLLVTSDKEKAVIAGKSSDLVCLGPVSKPTVPAKKATPASRILDHYTREGPVTASASKPKAASKEADFKSNSSQLRPAPAPQPAASAGVKRKVKSSAVRSNESVNVEEVVVKKVRRVPPEEEGGYKIKMPSGSTPRSQQILAKSKELARRKTVFQRLGSGTSSSTSSGTRSPPSAPAVSSTTGASAPSFTVTGLDSAVVNKKMPSDTVALPPRSSKSSSVFGRLGDKQVSSSTSNPVKRKEGPLQYAGILKSPERYAGKILKQKTVEAVTMVADSVDIGRTEVRERLGSVLKRVSSDFSRTSESKKVVPDSSKFGVKARLGGTSVVVSTKREAQREPPGKDRLRLASSISEPRLSSVKSASTAPTRSSVSKRGVFSRLGT